LERLGRKDAKKMFRDHLDATLSEALAHLSNDFTADIAAYDKVHLLALEWPISSATVSFANSPIDSRAKMRWITR